jgi:hypothetical protein
MEKRNALLVTMLGLLLVAGCSSPENRIQKSCIRGGGIGGMSIVSQQRTHPAGTTGRRRRAGVWIKLRRRATAA